MPAIREVHPADLDAMIELFRASVRVVARRDYTHEQVIAWAPDNIDRRDWLTRWADSRGWGAEIEGTLAGFCILGLGGHLDMMFTHPAYQGRGVATALLRRAEQFARESGIDHLHTEASITARPFFERRDFRLIAARTVSLRGQDFVSFRMEKDLPRA